ncbi:MAG: methylmalonyl-CoA epimerase [Spirochaetaceae bacterium]|nr:MAG: methylmalonyl-CoA epimerase [Spirochaetaceae bacterium]
MIKKINHIGIAVQSLDERIPFYRDVLGLSLTGTETVADQKVRVAMFRVGDVTIELLEPTDPESPIAKFMEKNGEGMHHVSYQVDDLEKQIADVVDKGVRMIDPVPRPGAHGTRIAFLHPKSTGRVLTELTEE